MFKYLLFVKPLNCITTSYKDREKSDKIREFMVLLIKNSFYWITTYYYGFLFKIYNPAKS